MRSFFFIFDKNNGVFRRTDVSGHCKKTDKHKSTDRKMKIKPHASTKSIELQHHPQADTVAAHLLLPNRTNTIMVI